MSNCTIPGFDFSISLPIGLPSFPSFSLPSFSLALSLACPID